MIVGLKFSMTVGPTKKIITHILLRWLNHLAESEIIDSTPDWIKKSAVRDTSVSRHDGDQIKDVAYSPDENKGENSFYKNFIVILHVNVP